VSTRQQFSTRFDGKLSQMNIKILTIFQSEYIYLTFTFNVSLLLLALAYTAATAPPSLLKKLGLCGCNRTLFVPLVNISKRLILHCNIIVLAVQARGPSNSLRGVLFLSVAVQCPQSDASDVKSRC